jgi:hypothetical protein
MGQYDRLRNFDPEDYDPEAQEKAQQVADWLEQKNAEAAERRAREATKLVETLRVFTLRPWGFQAGVQVQAEDWNRIRVIHPKITIAWGSHRIPVRFRTGQPPLDLEGWHGAVTIEGHLCFDSSGDMILAEARIRPRDGKSRPSDAAEPGFRDEHERPNFKELTS